jgi:hypothetical protein
VGSVIVNMAFGVSAAIAGSSPLLYADWTSRGGISRVVLHLTLIIALGLAIGVAKPDMLRLIARIGRWARGPH